MRPSISAGKMGKKETPSIGAGKNKGRGVRLWAVIFWLALWQASAMCLGQEILLVSPVQVLKRLGQLAVEAEMWRSVAFSISRILLGFLLGAVLGVGLAALAARFKRTRELLAPITAVIKSIPVASFVILALIFLPSRNLSVLISLLVVFPILYANTLEGIGSTPVQMLEMAKVFRLSWGRRLTYIYISHLLPYLKSSLSVAMGFCWKSGVAAEVIGIPKGSIGEKLYEAKIYLETADLFAWTLVIVLLSAGFERLFRLMLEWSAARLERS